MRTAAEGVINEAEDRELIRVNLDAAAAANAAGFEGLAGNLLLAARMRAEKAHAARAPWADDLLQAVATAEAEHNRRFPAL